MPMSHLKECPLDFGVPWRPASKQFAVSSIDHKLGQMKAGNFVKSFEAVAEKTTPATLEQTFRAAVRTKQWPSLNEARQATAVGGWNKYQTQRHSHAVAKRSASSPAFGVPQAHVICRSGRGRGEGETAAARESSHRSSSVSSWTSLGSRDFRPSSGG
eukprot:TRINITY_DN41971_c0_g1_i1.p1 TRINITY_DN41971_c0_g1~~TRINITY_DN41971_c0_g1_i1.p1  ORF type:complete len:158 (-),score=9.05 TRINITY_DN41971_c0_g1_i1:327-800(-)